MIDKEFLKASDIEEDLGVSRFTALAYMHMFLGSGRGFKFGRIYRVRREIYLAWVSPNKEIKPLRQFKVIRGGNGKNKRRYLDTPDVMKILDISHTRALDIIKHHIGNGGGFQNGRVYRVEEAYFYDWLADMDGYRPTGISRAV